MKNLSVRNENSDIPCIADTIIEEKTVKYTAVENLTKIVVGEKLGATFGKLVKAVDELINHLADNVRHITAAERTDWNGKAASNHTHTYIKELVPTKNENNEVDLNNLRVANSVGFWKIDSRQYTVLHSPTNSATQGLLTAVDFENGGFGEQYFSPYSSNTRYFRYYFFDGSSSKVNFGSWTKIFDGANAAAALKLASARKINGVGFDGTADITLPNATAAVNGLMSKVDKAKLDSGYMIKSDTNGLYVEY